MPKQPDELEIACSEWLATHNPNNVVHLTTFVRQVQAEAFEEGFARCEQQLSNQLDKSNPYLESEE